MICHDCVWGVDTGTPHKCTTNGCACQHRQGKDNVNYDALSKSKRNSNSEDAVTTESNSKID